MHANEERDLVATLKLEPGSTISHFRLEKKLGEGGMGSVYLAEDLTLSRRVAIKFMSRAEIGQQANEKIVANLEQRFIREARSAAAINHPNVAQIYEANFDSDNWYIAMEFIAGEALSAKLEGGKALPVEEAVRILIQTAGGLKFAWDHFKIVHRDIKPQNIMLTADNQVKIVDLGLAKPVVADEQEFEMPELTGAGIPIGTPQYMAPEQAGGEPGIDHRADIFALGATAYELLTGSKAFDGKTAPMIYIAQMHKKYRPLSEACPEVPSELATLIDRMLEPNRGNRLGSYEEMLDLLNQICVQQGYGGPASTQFVTASGTIPLNRAVVEGNRPDPDFYPVDTLLVQRYRIIKHIGKSRAGVGYLCIDTDTKTDCAVKCLKPGREFPTDSMPVIRRNLERLQAMPHPNLVTILDLHADERTGELFVVMELLRGQNLRQYTHLEITRHGDLDLAKIGPVAQLIAAALDSVAARHKLGHGDLKPESIYLIEDNRRVKLLDYALTEDPGSGPVVDGERVRVPLASPDYMAPELWRGEPLTPVCDQYSLGVILYEMISRKLPFWLKDQAAGTTTKLGVTQLGSEQTLLKNMSRRVLNQPAPRLPDLLPLHQVVLQRALAKNGAERFGTCAELVRAFGGKSGGTKKKPVLAIAAILVVVIGLLAAIALLLLNKPAEQAQDRPPAPASQTAQPEETPLPAPQDQVTAGTDSAAEAAAGQAEALALAAAERAAAERDAAERAAAEKAAAERAAAEQARLAEEEVARQAAVQARLKADAERLKATVDQRWQEVTAIARTAELAPRALAAEQRDAAAAALVAGDFATAVTAYGKANDALQQAENEAIRLAREEAEGLRVLADAQIEKSAALVGLDPAIDELRVKIDVARALARDAIAQQKFETAVAQYLDILAQSERIDAIAQTFKAVAGKPFTVPRLGIPMVWVAPLKLWAGKYEITNGQYRQYKPAHTSKKTEDGFSLNGDTQPVCWIRYYDAIAYCAWLNAKLRASGDLPEGFEFRLPSAEEWQALASCGEERLYPWGNVWPPTYGNFGNQEMFPTDWKLDGYTDAFPVTCPVDKSGENEWGLFGIAGNLWEWTTAEKDGKRAVYGGAWSDVDRRMLVIRHKGYNYADPADTYDNIGFRILLAPVAEAAAPAQ